MHLLIVGSFPPPYHGTSIYLKKMTNAIIEEPEINVSVIDISDHRNNISNLGKLDFVNVWVALKSVAKLFWFLLSKKIDIVYIPISQNILAYFRDGLFIILAKIFRCKVVVHLHGSYFFEFYQNSPFIYKNFIDVTISKVDGGIVLGENLKYIFEKWLPSNKIFVLPNFVEWSIDTDAIKREKNYYKPSDKKVILYLGKIAKTKGVLDLLEAVKIVKNKCKRGFVLKIAGEFGDDSLHKFTKKDMERLFYEYVNLVGKDIIEYVGMIQSDNEKYKFLKSGDIFVYPSWQEGQPLSILEAMSCGCPIISTKNVGAIEEAVIDGFNGFLIEKGNVQQLAEAILELLENDKLRETMGANSLAHFNKNFTLTRHLRKLKSILYTVYYGFNLSSIENLEKFKIIEPKVSSEIEKLRSYSFKKAIKFFLMEGFSLTYRKIRSKFIYSRIDNELKLVILMTKTNNSKIFLFTRMISYDVKYDDELIFSTTEPNVDIDSIKLSNRTLKLFEAYLPVYSCPKELKHRLKESILQDNPFLQPFTDGSLAISNVKNKAYASYSIKTTKDSKLRVFFLGFGSYIFEYVLKHFKNDVIAALDYKGDIIARYFNFSFPIYNDFEKILEPISNVDEPLVIVATYHSDHAWMAREVLNLNPTARVFIEKPACITLEDANLLVNLRNKGYWIDIGYNRRYAFLSQVIKLHIRSDEPAYLTFIVKEVKIPETHWYFWPNQGTRVFGNLTHWIDLVRFFMNGKQVKDIFAIGHKDSSLTTSLKFEDGSIANIITSDYGSDLLGVEEYIEIRTWKKTLRLHDYRFLEIFSGNEYKKLKSITRDKGHHNMYTSLKKHVLKKRPPLYPLEDIYWVTDIANKILSRKFEQQPVEQHNF